MIASISVPNASYKSSYLHIRVHVFCMLKKEKDLHEVSMFTFTKIFFPVLLNLGAQIRCAWNRCTAVQTDLKYPLVMLCKTGIWLGILHLIRDRRLWKMANPVHKYLSKVDNKDRKRLWALSYWLYFLASGSVLA